METQNKMIFDYLMNGCRVTGLEALRLFGTMRLPARIFNIEKMFNVTVEREWKHVSTKFGSKKVMEYYIKTPAL